MYEKVTGGPVIALFMIRIVSGAVIGIQRLFLHDDRLCGHDQSAPAWSGRRCCVPSPCSLVTLGLL